MIQFSRFSTEFSVTPPCLAIHDRNESRSLASPRQTKEKKLYAMTRSVIFSPSPIYVRHIYIHTRTYFSLRVALRVESLSFCWRQTGRAARRLGSFLAATKPSKVPLVAATPTTEGRERHACTRTRARTVSPFNPPRRALLEENGLENYFLEWWRRWNSLNSIKKKTPRCFERIPFHRLFMFFLRRVSSRHIIISRTIFLRSRIERRTYYRSYYENIVRWNTRYWEGGRENYNPSDDHVGSHGSDEKPGHRVQLVAKAAGNFNEIRVSEYSRLN